MMPYIYSSPYVYSFCQIFHARPYVYSLSYVYYVLYSIYFILFFLCPETWIFDIVPCLFNNNDDFLSYLNNVHGRDLLEIVGIPAQFIWTSK